MINKFSHSKLSVKPYGLFLFKTFYDFQITLLKILKHDQCCPNSASIEVNGKIPTDYNQSRVRPMISTFGSLTLNKHSEPVSVLICMECGPL